MPTAVQYIKDHWYDHDIGEDFAPLHALVTKHLTSRIHYDVNNKLHFEITCGDKSHRFTPGEEGFFYNYIEVDESPEYLSFHVYWMLWWGGSEYGLVGGDYENNDGCRTEGYTFTEYLSEAMADYGLSIYENFLNYSRNLEEVAKLHDLLGDDAMRAVQLAQYKAVL